jgi:hypothetical protein
MAFAEDLAPFFADFAVPVVWGAYSVDGILDMPTRDIFEGEVLAHGPALTYATSDLPGLTAGQSITVNGAAYTTRAPRALDDGALSVVELQA